MTIQLLSVIVLSYTIQTNCMHDFLPSKVSRSFHAEQEQQLEKENLIQTIRSFEQQPHPYAPKALKEVIIARAQDHRPVYEYQENAVRENRIISGDESRIVLTIVPRSLQEIPPAWSYPVTIDESLAQEIASHSDQPIREIIAAWKTRLNHDPKNIPKHILLTGPCGTGKSILPQAIAAACNLPCYRYSSISNAYEDAAEINLIRIFEQAALDSPCVIAFEDLENILNMHPSNPDYRVVSRLFKLLKAYKNRPILFIGILGEQKYLTTKLKNNFKVIEISLPNEQQRQHTFEHYFNKLRSNFNFDLFDVSTEELAKLTKGYSYREIENLIKYVFATKYSNSKSHDHYFTVSMLDFLNKMSKASKNFEEPFIKKIRRVPIIFAKIKHQLTQP